LSSRDECGFVVAGHRDSKRYSELAGSNSLPLLKCIWLRAVQINDTFRSLWVKRNESLQILGRTGEEEEEFVQAATEIWRAA
jgi:hypothetical protein